MMMTEWLHQIPEEFPVLYNDIKSRDTTQNNQINTGNRTASDFFMHMYVFSHLYYVLS